jgi:hypothetical protein
VRFWRPALAQVIENLVGDSVTDSGESANVSEIYFAFSQGGIPLAIGAIGFHARGESDGDGRMSKNIFN